MANVEEVIFCKRDEIRNTSTLNFTCPIEPSTYLIVSSTTEFNRRKVVELASDISESEDVEALLDLVSWKIFVYACQQACNSFKKLEFDFNNFCFNSTCCFTDSSDKIISIPPQCGNSTCRNFIDAFVITKWYIFLVLGLLCLFGNFVVICDKILCLKKQLNRGKEVQIYNVLVLNLSLADFLMGMYVTLISLEIKHKVAEGLYFSEPGLCNALGVINALSTQVSISVLLIISFYRVNAVILPYKNQHLKVVNTLVIIMWLVWLGIVILPLIPMEPFLTTFTFGLVKDRMIERDTIVDFLRVIQLFKSILESNALSNNVEIDLVLQSITRFPNVAVLTKASGKLGLVNFRSENWCLVGSYDLQYGCSTNFFIQGEENRLFNRFILTFVFYNFFASISILIAYILLSCKISGNHNMVSYLYNCCASGKMLLRTNSLARDSSLNMRSGENKKLYRRISLIVATNLLCWLPLCMFALIVSGLTVMTKDETQLVSLSLLIQTAMLFVVPFNSTLNPYIYSFHLWKRLFTKMKAKTSKSIALTSLQRDNNV